MVEDRPQTFVIYAASDANHQLAYEQVFEDAESEVVPINEAANGFRRTLIQLLGDIQTSRIFFLVDDIMFLRKVDLWPLVYMSDDLTVPSLRLGRNIVHSQIRFRNGQDADVFPPSFFPTMCPDLLTWSYLDAERDWAFPLSVDGHIFPTETIRQMLRFLEFHNPNTLEASLQTFVQHFRGRLGICPLVSAVVNNPCNQVQHDIEHPISGNMSADEFLIEWQSGYEIDVGHYYGYANRGTHEELPIVLRKRASRI